MKLDGKKARVAALAAHLAIVAAMVCVLVFARNPNSDALQVSPNSDARQVNCVVPGDDIGAAGGAELMTLSDDDLRRELESMRAAGVRWLRVGAEWSVIEQERGNEDWSVPDRVVKLALTLGFRILGILVTTPAWARNDNAPKSRWALPADPNEFGRFSADVAARYADQISVWEIWNEPNNPDFAKPRPNVSTYSAMISAAASQIRAAVNTPVQIVTAGLAPEPDEDDSIAPTTFINELYKVGDKSSWDAIGMHPYTYPYLPDDPTSASWNAFQRIRLIRQTMVRNGDEAKRIWLTEFGAPTGGPPEVAVSEESQADAIGQGIARMRNAEYFGPLFIHEIRDRGTEKNHAEENFGILHFDFSPKPAYATVSRLTRVC